MKTFQEWIKEYRDDQTSDEPRKLSFRNGDLIKAIQLDAYEKGIRDAAEKADDYNDDLKEAVKHIEDDNVCSHAAQWYVIARNDAAKAILSLLTKPKDKDLDDCFPLG